MQVRKPCSPELNCGCWCLCSISPGRGSPHAQTYNRQWLPNLPWELCLLSLGTLLARVSLRRPARYVPEGTHPRSRPRLSAGGSSPWRFATHLTVHVITSELPDSFLSVTYEVLSLLLPYSLQRPHHALLLLLPRSSVTPDCPSIGYCPLTLQVSSGSRLLWEICSDCSGSPL